MQLIQLQVDGAGKVRPFMRVKMSVGGEDGIRDAVWAGPGRLLAFFFHMITSSLPRFSSWNPTVLRRSAGDLHE